jgi:MFS family permease
MGHLFLPLLAGAILVARGWRDAYAVLAATNLLVIGISSQLLRRDPASRGLAPDGRSGGVALQESGLSLGQAAGKWQFWSVVAVYFAVLFCTYTVQIHIAAYAMDLGNSVTRAAGFLSIIGASSIAGRFGMGPIGDRFGVRKMMLISCAMLCLTLAGLALTRQAGLLYLVVPVYGLAHGSCYSLISPLVASLFGTRAQGAIYGIVIFGGTIGGAIGPLLAGYIFDRSGTYTPSFAVLSAMAAAGAALLVTLRPVKTEEQVYGPK